ncbi:MAG: hypothetical protein ACYC5A_08160 [Thermoleophilia bacterium]
MSNIDEALRLLLLLLADVDDGPGRERGDGQWDARLHDLPGSHGGPLA